MKKILKSTFFAFLILLLTFSVVSCSNSDSDTSKNTENTNKEFTVSIVADFSSISPGADISSLSKSVLLNMNSTLYSYDALDKEYKPSLAENITLDNNTLNITLKEGLTFHNDSPITTKDIVYSIKRNAGYIDDFTYPQTEIQNLIDKNAFTIIDDYNLEVQLNDEFVNSNTLYLIYNTIIVPFDYSEQDQLTHPISAGPYKFVSYTEGDEIKFEVFENYYGEIPEIKSVRFKIMSDPASTLMAYKNGELDYLSLSAEDAKSMVGTDFENKLFTDLANDTNTLFFNQEIAPFDNAEIREAIKYGINKDEVMSLSSGDYGKSQSSLLSPYQEAYYNNDLPANDLDIQKAMELMSKNGYSEGKRLKMELRVVSENKATVDMANIIKSNLEKIYVDVNVVEVPWDTYIVEVYGNKKFDTTILQLSGYANPYDNMKQLYTGNKTNLSGYSSETYDAYLDQILIETDNDKIIELYKLAQATLYADNPAIFLGDEGKIVGLGEGYDSISFYPFWFIDISSIKVTK